MEELIKQLKTLQADVVKMYVQAHGFHWNVEGVLFKQFHAFFLEIYEDVYDSIDPISENLRKLGAKAPFGLSAWQMGSDLDINVSENLPAILMIQNLVATNQHVLVELRKTFDLANAIDDQGIANFIAGRMEQHKFWNWQLTATLTPTIM